MQKILQGVHQFREDVFRQQQAEFERLAAKQQRPIALLITCSDSRINPNLITQTDPGDLFLIRNAGNIVPPYGAVSSGEIATIEYAVSVLGIRNIILCGHSHCGALDALMRSQELDRLPGRVTLVFTCRSDQTDRDGEVRPSLGARVGTRNQPAERARAVGPIYAHIRASR